MTPPLAESWESITPINKNKKKNVQSVWPDDYLKVSSDNQAVSFDPDDLSDAECLTQPCGGEGNKKRLLIRPQVTVNVFNTGGSTTGGSSAGGSGTGGSGTGGAATVNGGISGDPMCCLANQVASLTKKVEALSLSAPLQGAVVETGTWNTMNVRPWQKPQHETQGRINFGKGFAMIPTVSTGISSLDVSREANCRVRAFATDIDCKGFTIHVNSWSDTKLFSCSVSWVAIG